MSVWLVAVGTLAGTLSLVAVLVILTRCFIWHHKRRRESTPSSLVPSRTPPVLVPHQVSDLHKDSPLAPQDPPYCSNWLFFPQLSDSSVSEPQDSSFELYETTSVMCSDEVSGNYERESTSEGEMVLDDPRPHRVMIVYHPSLGVLHSQELQLVHDLNYPDIDPICLATKSPRIEPTTWLEKVSPTVDAILCIWSKQLRGDWDKNTHFTEALKTVVRLRKKITASVILQDGDKQYVPEMLTFNSCFDISQTREMGAFVKDIPLCVLKEKRKTTQTLPPRRSVAEPASPQ